MRLCAVFRAILLPAADGWPPGAFRLVPAIAGGSPFALLPLADCVSFDAGFGPDVDDGAVSIVDVAFLSFGFI